MSVPTNTLPTAPATSDATLPQQKSMKLNQLINVSRKDAVAGDSLVYTSTGIWEPQNVTPGAGDLLEPMYATGSVSTRALADGSVTDIKIGNRTVDDTLVPTVSTNVLTTLLSNLGNMIKQITGKASWLTSPAISLETLNVHNTRHSTGGADAITPAQIGASSTAHTHAGATTSVAGFLSSSDKTKLDSVATNAAAVATSGTPTSITANTSQSAALGSSATAPHSDHLHGSPGLATSGNAGFMSAAYATKVDGIAAGAAALAGGTVPLAEAFGDLGAVGTSTLAARADHLHAMPTAANILTSLLAVDGSGSLLDADKLDGHDSSFFTSIVGDDAFEEVATAARTLSTTYVAPTGISFITPVDATYIFFLQADFLCLDAADVGVAFSASVFVGAIDTGITANFTAGAINGRAQVAAFGTYFMGNGVAATIKVKKASGTLGASKAEISTTKLTGFRIS